MEGQAILALLAVLSLGMVTGGVIVSAAMRAFSGSSAPHLPANLPTINPATIEKWIKELDDLLAAIKAAAPKQ